MTEKTWIHPQSGRRVRIGNVGETVELIVEDDTVVVSWDELRADARGMDHYGFSAGPDPFYTDIYLEALERLDGNPTRIVVVRAVNMNGSDEDRSSPTWAVYLTDAAGRRITPGNVGLSPDVEPQTWPSEAEKNASGAARLLESFGYKVV